METIKTGSKQDQEKLIENLKSLQGKPLSFMTDGLDKLLRQLENESKKTKQNEK